VTGSDAVFIFDPVHKV